MMTTELEPKDVNMPKLEFEDLELEMRVFDMQDGRFGEIIGKQEDDPDWRMIEVKWECEDPEVVDVSYVLPGMAIGVVVPASEEMLEHMREQIGDQLDMLADEFEEMPEITVMSLVTWE